MADKFNNSKISENIKDEASQKSKSESKIIDEDYSDFDD
jgi:hypothetical protein